MLSEFSEECFCEEEMNKQLHTLSRDLLNCTHCASVPLSQVMPLCVFKNPNYTKHTRIQDRSAWLVCLVVCTFRGITRAPLVSWGDILSGFAGIVFAQIAFGCETTTTKTTTNNARHIATRQVFAPATRCRLRDAVAGDKWVLNFWVTYEGGISTTRRSYFCTKLRERRFGLSN